MSRLRLQVTLRGCDVHGVLFPQPCSALETQRLAPFRDPSTSRLVPFLPPAGFPASLSSQSTLLPRMRGRWGSPSPRCACGAVSGFCALGPRARPPGGPGLHPQLASSTTCPVDPLPSRPLHCPLSRLHRGLGAGGGWSQPWSLRTHLLWEVSPHSQGRPSASGPLSVPGRSLHVNGRLSRGERSLERGRYLHCLCYSCVFLCGHDSVSLVVRCSPRRHFLLSDQMSFRIIPPGGRHRRLS